MCLTGYRLAMDAPGDGRTPLSPDGAEHRETDSGTAGGTGASEPDADLVVDVLHRVGRCSLRVLLTQPELDEWSSVRLEQAVTRAWNGGLVFIDRNDDLVAL